MKAFDYSQNLNQNVHSCVREIFDMRISPQDAEEAITFKYQYELKNPKESEQFCDKCVAINPRDEKETPLSLPVLVKCAKNICEPNLKLMRLEIGNDAKDKILVGSTQNFSISFSLVNYGEPAYSTKVSIEVFNSINFISFSKSCKRIDNQKLICEIKTGKAFLHGENFNIDATLDVSKVRGNFLNISAEASSDGIEVNMEDNFQNLNLTLQHHSNIKVMR